MLGQEPWQRAAMKPSQGYDIDLISSSSIEGYRKSFTFGLYCHLKEDWTRETKNCRPTQDNSTYYQHGIFASILGGWTLSLQFCCVEDWPTIYLLSPIFITLQDFFLLQSKFLCITARACLLDGSCSVRPSLVWLLEWPCPYPAW